MDRGNDLQVNPQGLGHLRLSGEHGFQAMGAHTHGPEMEMQGEYM